MTKKLSDAQLKRNARVKAKKRAAQAKADKRLTAKLERAEKNLLKRLDSLNHSKARGKVLEKQRASVARQTVELIEDRKSANRKAYKSSIMETIKGFSSDIFSDFLAFTGALTGDESPFFTATSSKTRTREHYEKVTTLLICPNMPPMRGKDIGVTPNGMIVEQALLEAQKVIDQFTTRNDAIGLDFAIANTIDYDTATKHFSFQDHKATNAAKWFIANIRKMSEDKGRANLDIVFPLNMHILKKV